MATVVKEDRKSASMIDRETERNTCHEEVLNNGVDCEVCEC